MTSFWPADLEGLTRAQANNWVWFFYPGEIHSDRIFITIALHSLMPHIQERAPEASILDIFRAIQDNLVHRKMSVDKLQRDLTYYCLRYQPEILSQLPWELDAILKYNSSNTWKHVRKNSTQTGSLDLIWKCVEMFPRSAYRNIFLHYLETNSPILLEWFQKQKPKPLTKYAIEALLQHGIQKVQMFETLITPKALARCSLHNSNEDSLRYLVKKGFFQEIPWETTSKMMKKCYSRGFATGSMILWELAPVNGSCPELPYYAYRDPRKITKASELHVECESIRQLCERSLLNPLNELEHLSSSVIDNKFLTQEEKDVLIDKLCRTYGPRHIKGIFRFLDAKKPKSHNYDNYYLDYDVLAIKNIHNVSAQLMEKLILKYEVENIQRIVDTPERYYLTPDYPVVEVMLRAGLRLPSPWIVKSWFQILVSGKEKHCRAWYQEHIAPNEEYKRGAMDLLIQRFSYECMTQRALRMWKLGEELFGVTLSNIEILYLGGKNSKSNADVVKYFLDKDTDPKRWDIIATMLSCAKEADFYEIVDSYHIGKYLKPYLSLIVSNMRLTESRLDWWFDRFDNPDLMGAVPNMLLYHRNESQTLDQTRKLEKHMEIISELCPDHRLHYCISLRVVFVFGEKPKCGGVNICHLYKLGEDIYCFANVYDYGEEEERKVLIEKANELIAIRKTKSARKAIA